MIYVVCKVSNYVSRILKMCQKNSNFECLMCWSMPYFTSSENRVENQNLIFTIKSQCDRTYVASVGSFAFSPLKFSKVNPQSLPPSSRVALPVCCSVSVHLHPLRPDTHPAQRLHPLLLSPAQRVAPAQLKEMEKRRIWMLSSACASGLLQ